MDIILDKISFKYDYISFNNDCYVLKDYSLKIDTNLTHIIGPNGSGKSTLLNILAGKMPFEGKIYIDNELVDRSALSKLCVLVDQKVNLFENLTVLKNIKILAHKIDYDLIKEFKFESLLNKKVKELSGGYKKKLMILISLIIKPKLLLLDEYSNYLDKEFLEILNKKIEEYSKENVVIYVDHSSDIGGNIVDINEHYENNTCAKIVKAKSKFKFEYHFSFRRLITYAVMIIFMVAVQMFYSIKTANTTDMYCDYLIANHRNFNVVNLKEIQKDDSCMELYRIALKKDVICFENEIFPVENKIETNEKYCYVFSKKKELVNTYVNILDTNYLVCGYVEYNNKAFNEFTDPFGIYDSYLIPSKCFSDQNKSTHKIDIKYSTKDTIKEDFNHINIIQEMPDLNRYDIIYKVSIAFIFVYALVSYGIIILFEKKENDIISSYNRSKKDLSLCNIITNTIDIILCAIIACPLANKGAQIFIKSTEAFMDSRNVFDISRVFIYSLICILMFSLYKLIFSFIKTQKE